MSPAQRVAALRELLATPIGHVEAALAQLQPDQHSELRLQLLAWIGDGKQPLEQRIAAGNALGLIGDPRIDSLAPAMVLVPGGPFRMGMDACDVAAVSREYDLPAEWLAKACPQHEVMVDDFEIGLFPVTNGEWLDFLAATGHREGVGRAGLPAWRRSHPVLGVSFEAMLAYCQWLTRETGLRYRLPTEAEWEKAARGTDARAYPWGEEFDPRCANTREAGVGDTTPVGVFPDGASACGVLDMGGNVEECTASLYRLYPGSPIADPEEHGYRVTRGGCHLLDGDLARCDRRHGLPFCEAVGFRIARSRAAAGWERESARAAREGA